MTEELIVRHCSPTLAGLKTGNMFTCPYTDKEELLNEIRKINKCLESKGLRLVPLNTLKKRMLLYLYRPSKLQKDFSKKPVEKILKEHGYENTQIGRAHV